MESGGTGWAVYLGVARLRVGRSNPGNPGSRTCAPGSPPPLNEGRGSNPGDTANPISAAETDP